MQSTSPLLILPHPLLTKISSFVVDHDYFHIPTEHLLVCKQWKDAIINGQKAVWKSLREGDTYCARQLKDIPFSLSTPKRQATMRRLYISVREYLSFHPIEWIVVTKPILSMSIVELNAAATRVQNKLEQDQAVSFFTQLFQLLPDLAPPLDAIQNPEVLRKWLSANSHRFVKIQELPTMPDADIPKEVARLSLSVPFFMQLFMTAINRRNHVALEALAEHRLVHGFDLPDSPETPTSRDLSFAQFLILLNALKENQFPRAYSNLVRAYKSCTVPVPERTDIIAHLMANTEPQYLTPWLICDGRSNDNEYTRDQARETHSMVLKEAFDPVTNAQAEELLVAAVKTFAGPSAFYIGCLVEPLLDSGRSPKVIGAALLASFDPPSPEDPFQWPLSSSFDELLKALPFQLSLYGNKAPAIFSNIFIRCAENPVRFIEILEKFEGFLENKFWKEIDLSLADLATRLLISNVLKRRICGKILLNRPIALHISEKSLKKMFLHLIQHQKKMALKTFLSSRQLDRIPSSALRKAPPDWLTIQEQSHLKELLEKRSSCIIL